MQNPDWSQLQTVLAGEVIDPRHGEYDNARLLWNAMVDRRPAAIARCRSVDDVVAAIRFARRWRLNVAIRGGGHSAPGHSMCDDGLVVDLSLMRSVTVSAQQRQAWVQGGCLLSDMDQATRKFGLAVPAGTVSHTGVGGLTLGGGLGHIMRRYGLTIDSLLGAQVVTADARVLSVNADDEPELFWALRGGGGNFGVVTQFCFRLHPVPDPYLVVLVHEADRAGPVLRRWREVMANEPPDELMWASFFRQAAALPGLPPALLGKPAVISILEWHGEPSKAQGVLGELTENLAPQFEHRGPIPYLQLQSMMDALTQHGSRAYSKAGFFQQLPDDLLQRLLECARQSASARSFIEVIPLGGAVAAVDPLATAFPHRRARFVFNIVALWESPQHDSESLRWVRQSFAALDPYSSGGAYLNYMGADQTTASTAFGDDATLARLRRIKHQYDPDNVFCFNQDLTGKRG